MKHTEFLTLPSLPFLKTGYAFYTEWTISFSRVCFSIVPLLCIGLVILSDEFSWLFSGLHLLTYILYDLF